MSTPRKTSAKSHETSALIAGIVGIFAALGLGLVVGFINGLLVIRTKVPSFVVTPTPTDR